MCVRGEFGNSPGTTAQVPEDCFLKWRAGFVLRHVAVKRQRQVKIDWRTGCMSLGIKHGCLPQEYVREKRRVGNPPTMCIVVWYQYCGINVCGYWC